MGRALVVPGLDALLRREKIEFWIQEPQVINALSKGTAVLSDLNHCHHDLIDVLLQRRPMWTQRFDICLSALCVLQVGILRTAAEYESWNVLVGCSNGDAARSVAAGTLSLEDTLIVLGHYSSAREICLTGSTVALRRADGAPLSHSDLARCEELGAAVCRWSSQHVTLAGAGEVIQRLRSAFADTSYKLTTLYPIALHSAAMLPLRSILNTPLQAARQPNQPVVSSVTQKMMTSRQEMIDEHLMSVSGPIDWMATLKALRDQFEVTTVINAGPGSDLMAMSEGQVAGLTFVDLQDLLR